MMTHPTPEELQAQLDKLALQLAHMRWRALRDRVATIPKPHTVLLNALDRVQISLSTPGRCQHLIDQRLDDAEALADRFQWGQAEVNHG